MKQQVDQWIPFRDRNLYPTTFRWNPEREHHIRVRRRQIYIPLRSDETWHSVPVSYDRERIYIPLRSDETGRHTGSSSGSRCIYIPLRSDETIRAAPTCHCGLIYIPLRSDETVFISSVFVKDWDIYIPLRSDETDTERDRFPPLDEFISHYVQMKLAITAPRSLQFFRIYIPLRSDETHLLYVHVVPIVIFISHYVQMKRIVRKAFRNGFSHLYPTTFRWNEVTDSR